MMWEEIRLMGEGFQRSFYRCLIEKDRYLEILKGLGNTLLITFCALILGVLIGLLLALIKVTAANLKNDNPRNRGQAMLRALLTGLDRFASLYITVIRGIPLTLQLMIWFYIILSFAKDPIPVAILAYGINSGAYVCEIFRAGILSVSKGQTEAGRSLGLNYLQTMSHIVLPQAFKNALPSLGNEFIALLKETSIVGYIAGMDLTRAVYSIRNSTYDSFPLVVAALVYLILVVFITFLLSKLERRLRAGDLR